MANLRIGFHGDHSIYRLFARFVKEGISRLEARIPNAEVVQVESDKEVIGLMKQPNSRLAAYVTNAGHNAGGKLENLAGIRKETDVPIVVYSSGMTREFYDGARGLDNVSCIVNGTSLESMVELLRTVKSVATTYASKH